MSYYRKPARQPSPKMSRGTTGKDFQTKGWAVARKAIMADATEMATEFNRKKSAYESTKVTHSRSGSVDRSRVKRYMIDDDIFKRSAVLPTGKNHSFHVLVDWSGSMSHIIYDVVKQTLTIAYFCRMVNVEFEIFNFDTTERVDNYDSTKHTDSSRGKSARNNAAETMNKYGSSTAVTTALRTLLSSKMSTPEFEKTAMFLFLVSLANTHSFQLTLPRVPCVAGSETKEKHEKMVGSVSRIFGKYSLVGCTPLNDSLILLRSHLAQYKATNNVQVQNLIILSDGMSHYVNSKNRGGSEVPAEVGSTIGSGRNNNSYVTTEAGFVDKQTNKHFSLTAKEKKTWSSTVHETMSLLKALGPVNKTCYFFTGKSVGNSSKITHTFLGSPRGRMAVLTDIKQQFKKTKTHAKYTKFAGYDSFLIIPNPPSKDEGDETESFATAKALVKNMKKKINKRALVSDFLSSLTENMFDTTR